MRKRVRENQLRQFLSDVTAARAILEGAVGKRALNKKLLTEAMAHELREAQLRLENLTGQIGRALDGEEA